MSRGPAGWRRRGRSLFFVGLVGATCAVIIFPFYWMLITSMQSGAGLFTYPPAFAPNNYSFGSYRAVFGKTGLAVWMQNSLIVALVSTALALATGVSGAYALSRFRYRGKQVFALTILTTQMIPPLVLVIPLFTLFVKAGLTDSLAGLVLANFVFALPVVVWMMKAIFDSIPEEIEEAARIEGASWLYILTRITGPIALPGIVATGIFAFLQAWDEFMVARTIVTATSRWVASIGLASFIGIYITPWDEILAAAVVFTVPPVILFLLVQRYFIAGLSEGAVKG
jgi:multiple sugar transport system permease protein